MNHAVKTLIFAVAALVVVVVAFVSRPRASVPQVEDQINKPLFQEFKDPAVARELKIVKFDEKQGEFNEFEIRQVGGRWVIPSHSDYPADAETQLKEAATGLIDLIVVDAVSEVVDDHKIYGVVEPDPSKLKAGDEGVGTLVTMKGQGGKNLANLVISNKKVEGHADKKFVRRVGEDRVYVVAIDPAKLSTKFSDWIEKDLLKLNAFDVEQVQLKDYSVAMVLTDAGPDVRLSQRFELTASAEASGSPSWRLDKLVNFRGRDPVPATLSETEELNTQKLDDLKSALDNLEIVDVRKKPKGLGANLRADEGLLKDREGIQSLAALGFLPLRVGQGPADIYSANGEVICRMKDGVEYHLRFGNSAGAQEGGDATKLNRYVLVTARVNEAKFPPPVAEPLPDLPEDEPAKPKSDKPKTDAPKDDAPKEDEGAEEEAEPEAAQPPKKDTDEKPAEDKKPEDKKPDDEKQAEPSPEDAKKAAERKKAEIRAQRDRISKENKRREDDYNTNRKKAEDKAKELNARFADWYYVISEDVYKKVHLSRVDLIKEKAAVLDEGFGPDAFRKLEEGGLTKESEKKADGPGPSGLPPGFPGLPPGAGE